MAFFKTAFKQIFEFIYFFLSLFLLFCTITLFCFILKIWVTHENFHQIFLVKTKSNFDFRSLKKCTLLCFSAEFEILTMHCSENVFSRNLLFRGRFKGAIKIFKVRKLVIKTIHFPEHIYSTFIQSQQQNKVDFYLWYTLLIFRPLYLGPKFPALSVMKLIIAFWPFLVYYM